MRIAARLPPSTNTPSVIAFAARVLVVAAIAAAWVGCAGAKEARMDEAVFGKTERVYVGRFSLLVPEGAKRYGEKYQMVLLTLDEVVFQEPVDEAFERAWAAKLAQIEALKSERRRPHHIVGDVEGQPAAIDPQFRAVLYHAENTKSLVEYAALRQVALTGLWLSRPGPLRYRDAILKTIAHVGKAYAPRAPGTLPAKGDVFHLPGGAVMLPYREQESTDVVYRGGPLDVEIELSTESPAEAQESGLMTRFGEAVARAGAATVAGASVVRNRGRTAAGLKGEEFVMRDSEKGRLYFIWEFKGEKDSGTKPEIQLQMTTKDERQKEKMAFWDALVDSLKPASAP